MMENPLESEKGTTQLCMKSTLSVNFTTCKLPCNAVNKMEWVKNITSTL